MIIFAVLFTWFYKNFRHFRHPLFPLLALVFERCEQATQCAEIPSSEGFSMDIQAFVQHQEKDQRPFLTNDDEVDGLVSDEKLEDFRKLGFWKSNYYLDDKSYSSPENTLTWAGKSARAMQRLLYSLYYVLKRKNAEWKSPETGLHKELFRK